MLTPARLRGSGDDERRSVTMAAASQAAGKSRVDVGVGRAEDHGVVSSMNRVGNSCTNPDAWSSCSTASGASSRWTAPRFSASCSSRRAPMIGCTFCERAIVHAMATCEGVASTRSATCCTPPATAWSCSVSDVPSMRVCASGRPGRENLPERIPPASGDHAATAIPKASAIGRSSRSMSRCNRLYGACIGHESAAAALRHEHVIDGQDADIVRHLGRFGEAVPVPAGHCQSPAVLGTPWARDRKPPQHSAGSHRR